MYSLSACVYSMQHPATPLQAELLFTEIPLCYALTEGRGRLVMETFGPQPL